MESVCAVILVADPKNSAVHGLQEVLFWPMAAWVANACHTAQIGAVCAYGAEEPQEDWAKALIWQDPKEFLAGRTGAVLLLRGEMPLLTGELLQKLVQLHQERGNTVTEMFSQGGAIYCAKSEYLHENWQMGEGLFASLTNEAQRAGGRIQLVETTDGDALFCPKDPWELLQLRNRAKDLQIQRLCRQGVQVLSSDGVLIAPDAQVGAGTVLYPGTILKERVKIGANCVIGPNSLIENSTVGDDTVVNASQIYSSQVGNRVKIGPFTQLRPDCVVHDGVKIGDFVELKNSVIGEKTSVAHLTYIGDSDFGKNINVGCGVVTVNYDGIHKHRTTVEDDVFIGCNTNLVAPVTMHKGSYSAAGTTVTHEVPEYALVIGRSRQELKPGWAVGKRKKK